MTFFLPTLAFAFAAFCVWLTVRLINRRERWAKWTLAGVLIVAIGYPLSIGPACWLMWRADAPDWIGDAFEFVYAPIGWACEYGPDWIDDATTSYMALGMPHLDFPAPLSWFVSPSESTP
jgi:hypothetical protein